MVRLAEGRDGAPQTVSMAFDLLELNGGDLRSLPLSARGAVRRRPGLGETMDGVAYVNET